MAFIRLDIIFRFVLNSYRDVSHDEVFILPCFTFVDTVFLKFFSQANRDYPFGDPPHAIGEPDTNYLRVIEEQSTSATKAT
ncbi:MAG: hypothetical protein ABIQ95_06650, partial [Bdellovibrionia bacterium]